MATSKSKVSKKPTRPNDDSVERSKRASEKLKDSSPTNPRKVSGATAKKRKPKR